MLIGALMSDVCMRWQTFILSCKSTDDLTLSLS